jgi:WD40 repeat protein
VADEIAKGATKTMFVRNVRLLAVVGCALGLGAAGVALGLTYVPRPAEEQTPAAKPAAADRKAAKPAQDQSFPKTQLLVDAASAQPEGVALTGHKGAVRAIVFSRDGKLVATGAADKTVRVWDPTTGQQKIKTDLPGEATGVAFSPDDKKLIGACAGDQGLVVLLDCATGKPTWRNSGMRGCNGALAFSPDGNRVVAGSEGGRILMFDAPTGKILFAFEGLGRGRGTTGAAAFSPDGRAVIYGGGGGSVRLFDSQTGLEVGQFGKVTDTVTALVYFREGNKIAMADGGMAIRVLDVATGEEGRAFEGKKGIRSLALAPHGELVVIAREGGEIQMWDVASGKEERQFVAPETVNAVAFHPDGNRIATAGENGTAIVWDLTRDKKPLPKDFKLTDKDLTASWADLGSEEGGKAYAAMRMLRADPANSVPFLKKQLRPRTERPDEKQIKQLIADLDSDDFATREKASKELEKRGEHAENNMREALAAGPSLEAKKRLERLLKPLGQDYPLTAKQQRDVRAVRVLEQVGTPEARKLLEALTKESPGWWVTQAATASLERLKQREER